MPIAAATARETDTVLRDVVRLFVQAQRSRTACCTAATSKECEALLLLRQHDKLTVQTFAARMGLEKTWASRLLVRMETAGLIRRRENPADARSLLVELTTKGRGEGRKLSHSLEKQAASLLNCVPATERANVGRALVVLRDALADCLRQTGPDRCD
jgi:DNA-binding MarR family transcriptional regulator